MHSFASKPHTPHVGTMPHALGMTALPTLPHLRYFAPPADTGTGGDEPKPGEQPEPKPGEGDPKPGEGDAQPGDGDKGKSLADLSTEELVGMITDLRRENAGKRTATRDAKADADAAKSERDAITEAVVKALGIELPGDEKPTIESLQAALAEATGKNTASEATNADLRRENAVLRYAAGLGANGDALLDSRAFTNRLSAVDPSDAEAVKAAISAALTENSAFALVKVPGSSGGTDHTGGDTTDRAKSMREAVSKRLGFTQ